MEAFEAFAILSSFAVATFFSARWTLGPLARISGNSNARAQFTIADILCVFAQVQVLLGTLLGEWRMHPSNPQVQPLAVLLFVAIVSFWWVSVVLIERAGVRNFWPRVFLLMIGLPVGVLGSAVVERDVSDMFRQYCRRKLGTALACTRRSTGTWSAGWYQAGDTANRCREHAPFLTQRRKAAKTLRSRRVFCSHVS